VKVGSVAAGAGRQLHPRLQSGASGRPLNFTVRRRGSMSSSVLKGAVSPAVACALLTSCVRMGDRDVFLVTSEPVTVFATQEQSMEPVPGNSLAVLEPKQSVPVLDCVDVKHYQIYKIRMPDGRTGFVNAGHYTLRDKEGRPTSCAR